MNLIRGLTFLDVRYEKEATSRETKLAARCAINIIAKILEAKQN